MRKALSIGLLVTVCALGGAACGDTTVTSSPPVSTAPAQQPTADAVANADADLMQVDQLLRDIEKDVSAVDQDAATPEGDPAQ